MKKLSKRKLRQRSDYWKSKAQNANCARIMSDQLLKSFYKKIVQLSEQINNYKFACYERDQLLKSKDDQIAALREQLDNAKRILGNNSIVFEPEEFAVPYIPSRWEVPIGRGPSFKYVNCSTMFADTNLDYQNNVHVILHCPSQQIKKCYAFNINELALYNIEFVVNNCFKALVSDVFNQLKTIIKKG